VHDVARPIQRVRDDRVYDAIGSTESVHRKNARGGRAINNNKIVEILDRIQTLLQPNEIWIDRLVLALRCSNLIRQLNVKVFQHLVCGTKVNVMEIGCLDAIGKALVIA
jgi:hypothetical protein